jgi:hypothetical protein
MHGILVGRCAIVRGSAAMRRLVFVTVLLACKSPASGPPPSIESSAKGIDFGTSVRLFGALEGVTIGMPIAEVRAKVPALKPVVEEPSNPSLPEPPPPPPPPAGHAPKDALVLSLETEEATYTLLACGGVLDSVEIDLEGHTKAELWQAWGPPVSTEGAMFVFDRQHGVRAVVPDWSEGSSIRLTIEKYVPLATLIDADPGVVLGVSVLGRRIEDVDRALNERAYEYDGIGQFQLWPSEYSYGRLSLGISRDDAGVVNGWQFASPLFEPTQGNFREVLLTYAAVWGEPVAVDDLHVYFRKASPSVSVDRRYGGPSVSMTKVID